MANHHRQSDSRSLVGAGLLLLSYIGFFGSFLALGNDATNLSTLVVLRARVGVVFSLVILGAACTALHTKSMLWQVPLGCFAASALGVGIRILVTALFTRWQLVFGETGLVGISWVAIGTAVGYLMKALQARLLPERAR